MLEHLSEIEFDPVVLTQHTGDFLLLEKTSPHAMLDAQVKTADWLKDLGISDDEEVAEEAQQASARNAFKTMITSPETATKALSKITVPAAVRQIVGMLSTYDWAFVEQAQQLRGMAVAKIVEETDHPDARIRLKALELLGRVTEVGLFTDRIEIKKTELSDQDLNERIKEKLLLLQNAQKGHTVSNDIVDADYVSEPKLNAAID